MRGRTLVIGLLLLLTSSVGAQAPAVKRIVAVTFWNTLWRGHPVAGRLKPGEVAFTRLLDSGAREMATSDMIRRLTDEYTMEPWAAHLLIGAKAEYEVVTVMGSAAIKIGKRWLP